MTATIKNILLPTDFGPSSERAARYAAGLAKALGASVHLLHVIEAPPIRPRSWHSAQAHDRRYQEGRAKLAAMAAAYLRPATERITLEVRTGTPPQAIVDAAIDYGADLIVMSAPARRGVPNLRLQSVAECVLETAPCPVLQVSQSGAARAHLGGRVA